MNSAASINQERGQAACEVAQICNLLYRRFAIGRHSALSGAWQQSRGRQIANLRYSRLQICVTRRGGRAFTLIEVVLAIGIFAIVLVAINTAFFAALRLREHTSDAIEGTLPLNRALSLLRQDLQNASGPGGVLAGDFRSSGPSTSANTKGAQSSIAGGQYGGLDFFSSTGPLSDDVPWGDIQEVNYQLMDPADKAHFYGKDLVRSVTRNLLATSSQSADVQHLLSNVDSLDFFYFDGTQWRDNWDTSAGDTNLPLAVRVRLQMAVDPARGNRAPEPLQMVVLVDSQSSTNR